MGKHHFVLLIIIRKINPEFIQSIFGFVRRAKASPNANPQHPEPKDDPDRDPYSLLGGQVHVGPAPGNVGFGLATKGED